MPAVQNRMRFLHDTASPRNCLRLHSELTQDQSSEVGPRWSFWELIRLPPVVYMALASLMIALAIGIQARTAPRWDDAVISVVESKVELLREEIGSTLARLETRDGDEVGRIAAELKESVLSAEARVMGESDAMRTLSRRIDDLTEEQYNLMRHLQQQIIEMAAVENSPSSTMDEADDASDGHWDWATDMLGTNIRHKETSPPFGFDSIFSGIKRRVASWSPESFGGPQPRRDPEIVLSKTTPLIPGHCFAFGGSTGQVTMEFSTAVDVVSVGISHLPVANIEPAGAPRRLSVVAFDLINEEVGRVDNVEFGLSVGKSKQQWNLPARGVKKVTFFVHSNHGAPFTCIYRLIVEGSAA